jgi:hypothetical protein
MVEPSIVTRSSGPFRPDKPAQKYTEFPISCAPNPRPNGASEELLPAGSSAADLAATAPVLLRGQVCVYVDAILVPVKCRY